MPIGVLYAFLAYGLYSCCDAIIKGLGSGLTVYEIAFFTTLFSLGPALLTTPKGESWLSFWKVNNAKLVHLRCVSGLIGNACIIYAFTTIQLQDAYAIAFLSPIFIVIISVTMLGETAGLQRWFFLALSFCGTLLVVQPGFRELELGHLLAIVAAVCGATTTAILRRVSRTEKRVSLIGLASIYILVANGVMMAIDGFNGLTLEQLGWLLTIGVLGGSANVIFIAATRSAPASHFAPLQYTQIGWAVLFGVLFFKEFPNPVAIGGLAVVALAGVLNVFAGETRIFSRLSPSGAGPAFIKESQAADTPLEDPIAGAAETTQKP